MPVTARERGVAPAATKTAAPPTIVVALDGSEGAERAMRLVRSLAWPAGTEVRLVAVQEELTPIVSGLPRTEEEEAGRAALDAMLAKAATGVERATLVRSVRRGRPATEIVAEAVSRNADLVVMGSRGRGTLASLLLGSVAAEVVDQAPCPVLVARTDAVRSAIVADDGSRFADAARTFLARLPALAQGPLEVVSVAQVLAPLATGVAFTVRDEARAEHAAERAKALDDHRDIARRGSDALRAAGLDAVAVAREGDPTEELLTEAGLAAADLIVVGTHGRTGLERVVLGSVARKILTNARCSVLVVRGRKGD